MKLSEEIDKKMAEIGRLALHVDHQYRNLGNVEDALVERQTEIQVEWKALMDRVDGHERRLNIVSEMALGLAVALNDLVAVMEKKKEGL